MGILRGGTTVGEKWCPPTWRWSSNQQTVSAADQACASWVIHCLRRYWYLCWADTSWLTIHLPPGRTCYYYGGTDTSAGRTQAYLWGDIMLERRYAQLNDTHLLYLGWLVLLLTWAIHTLALHLRVIHIFLRLPGRYTTWLALHFIHWSFWAIHILFTDLVYNPGGVGGSVKIGDWVFDLVGIFPWLRSFGLTFRLLVLREYSYLGVYLSAVTIWCMPFVLVSCC